MAQGAIWHWREPMAGVLGRRPCGRCCTHRSSWLGFDYNPNPNPNPNPNQIQFLQLLDYNVCVSAAVYTEWYFKLTLTPNPNP